MYLPFDWLKSYLSERSQYVSLGNTDSNTMNLNITHAVRHGSVFGLLLFLIFINDFRNASSKFKCSLFADDSALTCIFKNSTSEDAIIESLTNELVTHSNERYL